MKLNEIPAVADALKKCSAAVVKALHLLVFQEEGDRGNRKRLREFTGFQFEVNSAGFDAKGSAADIANRICTVLVNIESLRETYEDLDDDEEQVEEQYEEEDADDVSDLSAQAKFVMSFRDVQDTIRSFSGDDNYPVEVWLAEFEETASIMGWNDLEKLVCAKRSLVGLAKLFIQSERNVSTWVRFKQVLKGEFARKVTSAELHQLLAKRIMHRNESLQEYALHMREIASRGNIETTAVIQYIVDGIPDSPSNKLTLYEARTMSELKEKLDNYAKVLGKSVMHKQSVLDKPRSDSKKKQFSDNNFRGAKPKLRCYNCNAVGHMISDCNKPKRERGTCFVCGKPDHLASKCPNRKSSQASLVHAFDQIIPPDMVELAVPLLNCFNQNELINIKALVDSGSPISIIKESIVPINNCNENVVMRDFTGFNHSKLNILGIYKTFVTVSNISLELKFHVVSDDAMNFDALLGRDFIHDPLINISFTKSGIVVKSADHEEKEFQKECLSIMMINETEFKSEPTILINQNLDLGDQNRLTEIVKNHLSRDKPDKPELDFVVEIRLTSDHKLFNFRPRRLAHSELIELQAMIDDLIVKGVIKESSSPYASPIVLVRKKTGDLRLCIDFRCLNKYTVRDRFPLPLISDQLDKLRGKQYFTKLDLCSAFHHIKLSDSSTKYTSFVSPLGQYEYLKMPFGWCNSPSVFMRFINAIFKQLILDGRVCIFLDDILIATDTLEENFDVLREVLDLMHRNLLELRLDKCVFAMNSVTYLGYHVDKYGISPCKDHIKAIMDYPIPKSIKEVQSYVGLVSYFRRFIPDFALKAKPLYDLLKKNATFKFGEDQFRAFDTLKNYYLISEPILSIYSPTAETQLHCDASSLGFGATLMQKQSDNLFHPIAYFSKRTYDYKVEHRPAKRMCHVDALSRCHNILILEDNAFELNLSLQQLQDQGIRKIRDMLEVTESAKFELRNGLVYRKKNDKILFVVPENMEIQIMHEYHDNFGHVGPDKTIELITRSYWFPNMRAKVKNHINNCLKCIAFSNKSGKSEGELHSIPKGNMPFIQIHVDHLGPFEKTAKGYKYVFEVIDGFTKFIKLYPCKTTNTTEIINYLKNHFNLFSQPLKVVADRGSCFNSNAFKEFLDERGIKLILISTGTPRANGQIERSNRDITPMMAKISTALNKWDLILHEVEFAINNTYHRVIKNTPSRLLFGVDQRGKVNDDLRLYIESQNESERDLDKIRDEAAKNIVESQDKSKIEFDRKHKSPKKYKADDFVMILNTDVTPGVNKKLIPKYRGPYVIKKVLANDRYLVSDVDGFQLTQIPYEGVIESARLKPWLEHSNTKLML